MTSGRRCAANLRVEEFRRRRQPMSLTSSSSWRKSRSLVGGSSSRSGSLISPSSRSTRGFSVHDDDELRVACRQWLKPLCVLSRFRVMTEHGPTMMTSRESRPSSTLAIARRVGDDVGGALADRSLRADGRRMSGRVCVMRRSSVRRNISVKITAPAAMRRLARACSWNGQPRSFRLCGRQTPSPTDGGRITPSGSPYDGRPAELHPASRFCGLRRSLARMGNHDHWSCDFTVICQ